MSAHTPGPWIAGEYLKPIPPWVAYVAVFAAEYHDANDPRVRIIAATGDAEGSLREQSIADARLIAAAPDLLAALKETRFRMLSDASSIVAAMRQEPWFERLGEAIAKAESK